MRRASILVLALVLALMALAPAATAAIEQGPVYVGCKDVKGNNLFQVEVNEDVVYGAAMESCPEMLRA